MVIKLMKHCKAKKLCLNFHENDCLFDGDWIDSGFHVNCKCELYESKGDNQ